MTKINCKGDLMKLVYTEQELRNIDAAIPMELWQEVDTATHVMNYNDKGAFGELEDMEVIAEQRNIKFEWSNIKALHHNSE